MKIYICKKSLVLDCYDDDGYLVENSTLTIDVGEVYKVVSRPYNLVAPNSHIHLERIESAKKTWCEISATTLEEHFEERESQKKGV